LASHESVTVLKTSSPVGDSVGVQVGVQSHDRIGLGGAPERGSGHVGNAIHERRLLILDSRVAARCQAVAQTPVQGAAPGTIVEVYSQGYRFGDEVLRAAKVVVAA